MHILEDDDKYTKDIDLVLIALEFNWIDILDKIDIKFDINAYFFIENENYYFNESP